MDLLSVIFLGVFLLFGLLAALTSKTGGSGWWTCWLGSDEDSDSGGDGDGGWGGDGGCGGGGE
jgi:hypothetical protein